MEFVAFCILQLLVSSFLTSKKTDFFEANSHYAAKYSRYAFLLIFFSKHTLT